MIEQGPRKPWVGKPPGEFYASGAQLNPREFTTLIIYLYPPRFIWEQSIPKTISATCTLSPSGKNMRLENAVIPVPKPIVQKDFRQLKALIGTILEELVSPFVLVGFKNDVLLFEETL